MQLTKTITLVSGANGALGLSICRAIQAEGGRIIATDLQQDAGEGLKLGINDQYISADLTDSYSIRVLWETVENSDILVTGLVNNAGVGLTKAFEDVIESEIDLSLSVNVKAPFLMSQSAIKHFRSKSIAGSVVNIGSVGSFVGTAQYSVYTMTKHAIAGMTRSLAVEVAPEGIRVNAVCPGPIWTPMLAEAASNTLGVATPDDIAKHQGVPRGKLGQTEDIANAVCWLLSDKSGNCFGSLLACDGGYIAH